MPTITPEEYSRALRATLRPLRGHVRDLAPDALQAAALEWCRLPSPPESNVAWLVRRARLRLVGELRAAGARERCAARVLAQLPEQLPDAPQERASHLLSALRAWGRAGKLRDLDDALVEGRDSLIRVRRWRAVARLREALA